MFLKSEMANTKMSKIQISTHTSFQPLKTVLLGQTFDLDYFHWIKDPKIKDPLTRILEETHEDLENMKAILKKHGVEVVQPAPIKSDAEKQFANGEAFHFPPLQPRDVFLTLGNKLYSNTTQNFYDYIFDYIDKKDYVNLFKETYKDGKTFVPAQYNSMAKGLISGAFCYKIGKRIVIPKLVDGLMRDLVRKLWTSQGYEVVETEEVGHTDGVLSVIKPGAMISLHGIQNYKKTFPGWDVLYLDDIPLDPPGWDKLKYKPSRWWIPGEESNEQLHEYVDTWFTKWTGNISETLFDLNMLSLSEEAIMCTHESKRVFDFLKKHKVEPIITPLRHRYFWDGGLHCITLDLVRDGNREDYFN